MDSDQSGGSSGRLIGAGTNALPEFRVPQRGRLLLRFTDSDDQEYGTSDTGWIKLDGGWAHLLADENESWQSWPARNVVCVEWDA